MITENNIKELNIIISNLSNKDWYEANKNSARAKKGRYTPSGKERKWNSYSLSSNTIEAYDKLNIALKKNITNNEIKEVKSYLLKIKMCQPELLTDIRKYSFN